MHRRGAGRDGAGRRPCGVEALTYPFIKDIAARLGVTLVPLTMDEEGVRPDAVQKAHREAHLSALYIQPTIPESAGHDDAAGPPRRSRSRRRELGLPTHRRRRLQLLGDEAPLARSRLTAASCSTACRKGRALASRSASSFRRRALRERIMASVRSGGWTAPGFALAAGTRMMGDGTVSELVRLKRIDAARRQQMAAKYLAGFEVQANEQSYHLWLTLPTHWRSQTFVAAAARRDIALTPSTTFAVAPGHAPNAVRLALGAPTTEQLDSALRTLGALLTEKEDFDTTE
jgi:DNA-binding transcriptional MocR family regulator